MSVPSVYVPPAPIASFEPYGVAPGVPAGAVQGCAALDIAAEVFAAVGKSTLRADSTGQPTGDVMCMFGTDSNPNSQDFLAVGTNGTGATAYNAAPGTQNGMEPQQISGIGDNARFYGAVRPSGIAHGLMALKGPKMATVLVRFKVAPAGSDLSPARYGAIISKIFSR